MYFSSRRLGLFIVVLAQIVTVLGDGEEHAVQTIPVDIPTDQENEVCTEDERHNESKNSIQSPLLPGMASESSNATLFNCLTNKVYKSVEIVNATRLMELLIFKSGPTNRTRNDKDSRKIRSPCIVVLFYAKWCTFSSFATPHFHRLSLMYPHIKAVAIDAVKYQSFSAQYGIIGVPTLILIHNGKPVARFNGTTYSLKSFVMFIEQLTNLPISWKHYRISSSDFSPLSPTPSNDTDFCLVLSWVFIAACVLYFTSQSRWWQQFVELVQNTWRESNAQHEHAD